MPERAPHAARRPRDFRHLLDLPAMATERVGLIGLGLIGGAWALHYAADGVLAATWNRTAKPGAPSAASDPAAVARASSVVHIVVADPRAVDAVLDAFLFVLETRHFVIQSSTVDAKTAERSLARVTARGASYVEAPFTGSLPAAQARKTIFFLGGESPALERAETLLAHVSERRHRIGSVGQAAALKLSFNVLVGVLMQGMCESLVTARRAGIGDDVYFECLRGTPFWSGFHTLKEPKLRAGEFSPQFSVKHLQKDLRLATAMSGEPALPLASVVRDRLAAMVADGMSEADMSALITTL